METISEVTQNAEGEETQAFRKQLDGINPETHELITRLQRYGKSLVGKDERYSVTEVFADLWKQGHAQNAKSMDEVINSGLKFQIY